MTHTVLVGYTHTLRGAESYMPRLEGWKPGSPAAYFRFDPSSSLLAEVEEEPELAVAEAYYLASNYPWTSPNPLVQYFQGELLKLQEVGQYLAPLSPGDTVSFWREGCYLTQARTPGGWTTVTL